jgi:hypothetical protein
MANTPAQDQYDADFAQLSATPKSSIGEAAWNQLKKAFDLKYPDGRPKDPTETGDGKDTDGAAQALAFGLTEALIKAFPELQEVYDLFLKKDYTEARLKYFATNYYKNLTELSKTRKGLKATAFGQYTQLLDSYRIAQRKRLVDKGINLDDDTFNKLTEEGFDSGLDENQLDVKILNSGKLGTIGGTTLGAVTTLKTYADDYGVNQLLNKAWWDQKSIDLFAGKTTDDDIQKEIRDMSASAYAAYAPGIMAGRSLASQTSALKQTYANIYGIDPDTIQYDNKTFMKLLQYVDPKTKQPIPIPIWEAEKVLKSQEDYLYTKNAIDSFDEIGASILKDWRLI